MGEIKKILRINPMVIKTNPVVIKKIPRINHLVTKEMEIKSQPVKMMFKKDHSQEMEKLPMIMAFIIATVVHQVKLSKRLKKTIRRDPFHSNQIVGRCPRLLFRLSMMKKPA